MNLRTVVICILALIVAFPLDVLPQSVPLTDWSAVVAVPSDQKLVIELNSGKHANGKMSTASDTGLSIMHGKEPEDIKRSDIRKVYRETGTSVKKSTLVGAGIGGAGGAVAGAAVEGCDGIGCTSRGQGAAVGALFFASVGAVTGLVIGLLRHHKTLIYQSA